MRLYNKTILCYLAWPRWQRFFKFSLRRNRVVGLCSERVAKPCVQASFIFFLKPRSILSFFEKKRPTSLIPPSGVQIKIPNECLPDDSPTFQECIVVKGFSLQKECADDNIGRIVFQY